MSNKVLIIEDDRDAANLLMLHLRDAGYEASLAFNGNDGLKQALSKHYDLIILDLILPDVDGLEICRRIRASHCYVPILMLTSRASAVDPIVGLEIGADDYMSKPFNSRELLARIKALFRRVEAIRSETSHGAKRKVVKAGGLVIDMEKRKVTLHGNSVHLTVKEFDLLVHLVSHPGIVYTRSELQTLAWGYGGHEGYEHTINSHINRLRAKIEVNAARPSYILTVRGIGYKFYDS